MNMKYAILPILAAISVAASAAAKPAATAKSPEPVLPQIADENPYANYDDAMRSVKGKMMAVEWQAANSNLLEKATSRETLAGILADAKAVSRLLSSVGEPYKADPVALTQIAAISQLVMCPKCDKAPKCRWKWTAALVDAAKEAKTPYATMFFLDQLRWCGHVEEAKAVREIGAASSERAVKDFAKMVADEISTGAK